MSYKGSIPPGRVVSIVICSSGESVSRTIIDLEIGGLNVEWNIENLRHRGVATDGTSSFWCIGDSGVSCNGLGEV